jgi:predicted RNA binding protein YcfA (HicA-like mRNA interferase family)
MPKLPGVNHKVAIRAFERLGYRIMRQSKHVVMTDGIHVIVIPRNNPINPYTMGVIIRDAGLTIDQFRRFL